MSKLIKNRLVVILLSLALVIGLVVAGCAAPAPEEEEPIKMAFGTLGSKNDTAWSQAIYEGYLHITENYPEVETSFSEIIPWGDFPVFLETEGGLGADLVYLDSAATWMEALKAVAPKYPDTWFIGSNSEPGVTALLPPNVATYHAQDEQACFMAGAVAGLITESNKISFIGAMDYPIIVAPALAWEMGAKWANPDVEAHVSWIGDWIEVERGYETGKAAFALGPDVMFQYSDESGQGAMKAAAEAGAWIVGAYRNQYEYFPDNVITSVYYHHSSVAERALEDYMAGTITHEVTVIGAKEGVPLLAPFTNIPAEVEAVADKIEQALAKGDIVVPVVTDPALLGKIYPEDYGIPSAEELGITLP